MKYRTLGSTGLRVSEIGFGGWGIGGSAGGSIAYGKTEDATSCRVLKQAYETGITFYDTSDFYGFGHSESLIGQSLCEIRSHIVIASKVGLLDRSGKQDFSKKHLTQALEESLKRLKTDYIDLYQLHSPPVDYLIRNEEVLNTMQSFVKSGKVRAIGISARSPEEALVAAQKLDFSVIQANFNLADQRSRVQGLLSECEAKGVGFIARTPLCFGFLTGNYSSSTEFSETDHRRFWSKEQLCKWDEARNILSDTFEDKGKQSGAQLALRFCLSYPAVATAIPGMLLPEHVEENSQASDFGPLSENELRKIESVYQNNIFFLEKRS